MKAFYFLLFPCFVFSQIHVMVTSAQLRIRVEERTEEYLRCFYALKLYGFDPWIIEATNINSSLFDTLSKRVLYPQKHNDDLKNKGVNETMSMRACIPFLPFEDEDIVVKITGRYYLYDRTFFDIIKEYDSDFDAFVCYGKNFVGKDHIFTGCLALRWKYFKQLINEMDFEKAERDYISVEQLYSEFIAENKIRTLIVDPLNVIAKIYYNPEWSETYVW